MKKKVFYWIPRLIAILLILFYGVFTLDVFQEYSGQELFIALFMQLLPCLILTLVLILAWFKGIHGGFAFISLGFLSIWFFSTWKDLISFLLLSMPLIIVGFLFIVEHIRAVPAPYKK